MTILAYFLIGITTIQKRIIIAIRCSIRLEVPLGRVGSIMVPQGYVRYLVGIANEKMQANRKRTDGFLHVLQYKVQSLIFFFIFFYSHLALNCV